MLIIQRIFDEIREYISKDGDATKDEFEELWDEEVEEAEDDVMGLALSFTFVSAIRFLFDGCLPNHEGKEECEGPGFPEEYFFHHTTAQQCLLIALGLFWAGAIFILKVFEPECLEEKAIKSHSGPENKSYRKGMRLLRRLNEGIYVATRMCFAWAFFFGGQEILASFPALEGQEELVAVLNALILSMLSLIMLWPLDWLRDQPWTKEKTDAALDGVLRSLGLIIGFSWEQCFDASVDSIAEKSNSSNLPFVNVHTTKMGLTVFCGCLLLPAWYKYILKYCVEQGWHPLAKVKASGSAIEEWLGAMDKKNGEEEEVSEEDLKKQIKEIKSMEGLLEKLKNKAEDSLPKVKSIKKRTKSEATSEGVDLEGGNKKKSLEEPLLKGSDSAADEGLKNEVARLKAELSKEKDKSAQAQAMLDDTLQKMMASMKQMHVTVARIEGTA
jgi:hypothetical protein